MATISKHKITAVSPGKAILLGEHFVVYGYPSIIASINKNFRLEIQFIPSNQNELRINSNLGFSALIQDSKIKITSKKQDVFYDIIEKLYKIIEYLIDHNGLNYKSKYNIFIQLNSEIPLGGGLGSSSALCVALSGALYYLITDTLNKDKICYQSLNAEKILNKDVSGADCNICTYGGLGKFKKSFGFERITANFEGFEFLIIDTGISHDTSMMIDKVSRYRKNYPKLFKSICKEYENIYESSMRSIHQNDMDRFGVLINKNHELLAKLSLSNQIIDKITGICNSEGALGTKITGAGGGGSVLSLVNKNEKSIINNILTRLDTLNLKYFFAKIDHRGLRIIDN